MPALDIVPTPSVADRTRLGTRFLVYPQPPFIAGYEKPEVVWLSSPPGEIGPGPSNRRLYVVDPITDKEPYAFPFLPPHHGPISPPVIAGPDGHFDHLEVGTRQFLCAHVFACTHRVLDICEAYARRDIPWFFSSDFERLEIVPRLPWNNAHSGYGFLEMGEDDDRDEPFPYALNFDAIAHETAHLVLLGTVGTPSVGEPTADFLAYHEAVADFVSLLGLLHFDTAVDRILRRTRGNLLITNELDRFAEKGDERQIRVVSHSLKLADVGAEIHDASKPFAGALFDTLIEVFHVLLSERGLSRLDLGEVEDVRSELTNDQIEDLLAISRADYERTHFAVKSALLEARDITGEALAGSWSMLQADGLSFGEAAEAVLASLAGGRGRRFVDRMATNFRWRGIG